MDAANETLKGGPATSSIADRTEAVDWGGVEAAIAGHGHAGVPSFLTEAECRSLIALYPDDALFRKRIDMGRHSYGVGDYAYFAEPLPAIVAAMRAAFYARLAPIANRMMADLRSDIRYPETLDAFLGRCHDAGQTRPTPLMLHYEAGGNNRLHRDLYGDILFPLQVVSLLSRREVDFTGGEFLLLENRPRQQARGEALILDQGDLVIFPVFERPVAGKRGLVKAAMRHGVSQVRSGERYTLGIIFHDAA